MMRTRNGVLLPAIALVAIGLLWYAARRETVAEERPPSAASQAVAEERCGRRSIEHRYGSTHLAGDPERVVSLGYTDQDPILALGVMPVAIRDWFGGHPHATWPWAREQLGGSKPEVLPFRGVNFEQIAALDPDLIIGVSSGMTEREYQILSQIAPTVAPPGGHIDYGVPWQEQTQMIGLALCREEQAEELVAGVEERIAALRAAHPELAGASGVVASMLRESYYVYGPQDVRGRLLTSLGFVLPSEVANLAADRFSAPISRERLDLLDADVLIWYVDSEAARVALENDPIYRQLRVAREGRALFLDERLAGAISFSSVLSLPVLLNELVPVFAAILDGDPATGPYQPGHEEGG